MAPDTEPLTLLGAPGSPYTRKMLALLRYRRIAHKVLWGGHQTPPAGYPVPKVKLLPTFYFPDAKGELEAVVDSTPIVRRLETIYPERAAIPGDPVLGFLNDLIEDYGDEWLTKPMFHYRWRHHADRENAGPLLVYWSRPTIEASDAEAAIAMITKRQFERLYVVGSNEITQATIEQSFERFLGVLDTLIQARGYVLGARPCSADFAIFGQMTQLGVVEPTSAALTARAPRVRAWIDRMEDLSGLEPQARDWSTRAEAAELCGPLLAEIGRVYAPFLLANAAAFADGEESFATEIDNRPWTQPTFAYQAKCLTWIQESYRGLSEEAQGAVAAILAGTGCERLISAG